MIQWCEMALSFCTLVYFCDGSHRNLGVVMLHYVELKGILNQHLEIVLNFVHVFV